VVHAVSASVTNGFREVETDLGGAHFRGFASAKFLKDGATPPAQPNQIAIPAAELPHPPGSITKRTAPANGFSLNEPNQPMPLGATPAELCASLASIIAWLAVDKPANKRYQPVGGTTFCNIYAHDYCFLAGVYLPRVWWTANALIAISQGKNV